MNNGTEPAPVDPALGEHLAELADLAHDIGASQVLILREPRCAQLSFAGDVADLRGIARQLRGLILDLPLGLADVQISARGTIELDAALIVVLSFPATDGQKGASRL